MLFRNGIHTAIFFKTSLVLAKLPDKPVPAEGPPITD
jgi:hypothetical protein